LPSWYLAQLARLIIMGEGAHLSDSPRRVHLHPMLYCTWEVSLDQV
jgi:hypothetical protein